MKKILFLLSAAVLLFASCEGPAGRDGFDGLDGKDGAITYRFVKEYTVNTNSWELVNGEDQLNSFFRYEIEIPQLDREIYNYGDVFCYMFQNVDGDEVQTLLPFHIPIAQDNGNGQTDFWSETYFYDFMEGSIMIYVYYSDFYTNNRPGTSTFRVVLNY